MRKFCFALILLPMLLSGCHRRPGPTNTVTVLIESSPTNLDPRIGVDAPSERIDMLLFDALVHRDKNFGIEPWLAERWETPDPQTYVFHLHQGIHFTDGRTLTSRDVKWTIDSILNGTVVTVKANGYQSIASIDTPDRLTVIFHLKRPDSSFLWNLCDGASGIVPYGSGADFWRHPIGTGPFKLVSQAQDRDVLISRNPAYWQAPPRLQEVRFAVVPDATTRALELQKGSADLAINAFPSDMVAALARNNNLIVESGPGTILNYITFNTRDPLLRDIRVRQAIALAINRPLIIQSLFDGRARLAESLLPPEHWAWTAKVEHHPYNPQAANALLDRAGYPRASRGIRFHIAMKTSTDETTRLLAMVLQQQLAAVGIQLDLRSFEFATFYADITRGAFQMAPSRWIGGNEAPDIFRYSYAKASFPPHGANRGYYENPEVDRLLADAAASSQQAKQAQDYQQIQQIVAHDLPTIDLWYLDTVAVHTRRLKNLTISPSGDFNGLRTAFVG